MISTKKIGNKKFFAFSRPIESFFKFGDKIHFVWKDINSVFLGCSDVLAIKSGLMTSNLIGLDDRDLIWRERAAQYRSDEKLVLNLKTTRCIQESLKTVNGDETILTFKTPMIDSSGFINGIFGICFTLKENSLLEAVNWINQLGILAVDPMLLPVPNQALMQQLSKREQECLYHLTHGKSVKEIAKLLVCSPRTIETHIDNMKAKLQCYTRSELVSKAQNF